MSFELNSAFERREEWKAARLSEVEYQEIARALKALASEHGASAEPAIDALAHKGLDAALGVIAATTGAAAEAEFHQFRARDRLR
ncbi:hypothetical protein H7F50_14150 [Novosphingobium flavum]|jgi:CHASE3 domain sensor protein|uniref:Uncharacterized protein n=1 Tax=Novosphingobium aerophilum TaxID=2839843 RepID=A0A7X1KCX5_9SPHN|nr:MULTISPECIES: hypothetical protein [Novosphingobium]MBC2652745.1 hypothetical protein [Novosphingobium aerophilum]MBC2662897.1 hypothetical protein [Novosphingobium aerophilum]